MINYCNLKVCSRRGFQTHTHHTTQNSSSFRSKAALALIGAGIGIGAGVWTFNKNRKFLARTKVVENTPQLEDVKALFESNASGDRAGVKVMTIDDVKTLMGPLSEEKVKVL